MSAVAVMSPESVSPFVAATSMALLRTIAEVLDIRSVFPRVSEIVRPVVPHDALMLVFLDRAGRVTLEARSADDLPQHGWRTRADDQPHAIVADLRWPSSRLSGGGPPVANALAAAGYRSVLSVRTVARNQVMHLEFVSRQASAYTIADLPAAQHVADYVSLAVAHEQLAAAECSRAEARRRSEQVAARVGGLAENGEPLRSHGRMIGQSDSWQRVLTRALRVAPTDTTVFLQGESGTGKEVVARFIHRASPRKDGPFVAINCAALPDQLLESELFGYERGAFTGAHQNKARQIELASRGVLFLDEVREMSLLAQAKFLRFLQEREFQRLGATRTQKADVRVIAASNRDLRQAVQSGTFREDLFYRLQVFDILLPALRERLSDVPLLAEQFLSEIGEAKGGRPTSLADDARDALLGHDWPGNVRELRNVLERAAILSDEGVVERCHLSLHAKAPAAISPHDLETSERQTIENMLRRTDWNKAKAARQLGLTRTQLYIRLRRHGLEHSSAM